MIGCGLAGCLNFVAIFSLVLECFVVKEGQLFVIGKCWQKDTTRSRFFLECIQDAGENADVAGIIVLMQQGEILKGIMCNKMALCFM
jgi:hypothetical protein